MSVRQVIKNETGHFVSNGKNVICLSPDFLNKHFVSVPDKLGLHCKPTDDSFLIMLHYIWWGGRKQIHPILIYSFKPKLLK